MKKRLTALVLAVLMLALLCACGGGTAAPADSTQPADNSADNSTNAPAEDNGTADFVKLNLRFATFLTEQNPAQGVIDTLQAKLDEYMPDYVEITTYGNGTLLTAGEIYSGVVNGTCDIGLVQPSLLPGQFPVSMIMEYPAIRYNSSEVGCRTWTEFLRENDLDEYKDVQVLFGYGSGPGCIFSKKPITSMSDFSGMQIRATSTSAEAIAAYGATPSSMEISEVYEALRSGLVDGCYTMFGAGAVLALQEVSSYALITPFYSTVYTYCMNKDTWNSMPAAQQELFMKAIDEMCEEYNYRYGDDALVDNPSNIAAKEVMNISFMEGQLLDDCAAAGANLLDDYVAKLNEQGIDGAGYVEKIQAIADKYNAEITWDDYMKLYE